MGNGIHALPTDGAPMSFTRSIQTTGIRETASEPSAAAEPERSRSLRQVARILRRRTLLIALMTASLFALVGFLIFQIPPVFRSTSIVEVASLSGAEAQNQPLLIRGQLDVISTAVADRVIDRLHLSADPEFNPVIAPPSMLRRIFASLPIEVQTFLEDLRHGSWNASTPTANDVPSLVGDTVRRGLEASNDGRSNSIYISFSSAQPHKATQIANMFAEEYLNNIKDQKRRASAAVEGDLSQRESVIEKKLLDAEKTVQEFRENIYRESQSLFPTRSGATTSTSQQLTELNSQLATTQAMRSDAEARFRQVGDLAKSNAEAGSVKEALNSVLIERLTDRESQLRQRVAELTETLGPLHPRLKIAQAELDVARLKIAEEVAKIGKGIANEVDIAKAKERLLQARIQQVKQKLSDESESDQKLQQLERRVAVNQKIYEDFLGAATRIRSGQILLELPTVRVISYAAGPGKRAGPSKPLLMGLALIFSQLLAIVSAFIVEHFDRSFRVVEDVERVTGCRSLALIPKVPSRPSPHDHVLNQPRGYFTEALRSVRALMHQTSVQFPPVIVAVTSSVPQEGKTFFCISFARLLALSGRKVLLVEGDLRHPQIGKLLKASDPGGIVDVLRGLRSLDEVVRLDERSGMHYVIAGSEMVDPQTIFTPRLMANLKAMTKHYYDIVIIDTPPILPMLDAGVIAQLSDLCLFVVRWSKTPRDVVMSALRELFRFVDNTEIILAQVDLKRFAKYDDAHMGYCYSRFKKYYASGSGVSELSERVSDRVGR